MISSHLSFFVKSISEFAIVLVSQNVNNDIMIKTGNLGLV